MRSILVHDDMMSSYDLGPTHPLRPERFTLAIALIDACGLVSQNGPVAVERLRPRPASTSEVERIHDPAYVDAVRRSSADPEGFDATRWGIGLEDTPARTGLFEASLAICGGTIAAVEQALHGARTFVPAGGLHHAHRSRAAGFCVFNDPAVAIATALDREPALRIMYLDIDAHHGDGVQEAFYDSDRVLTLSIHETGEYLFPGTGRIWEIGRDDGLGASINVPLLPYSDDACYEEVFEQVVVPAAHDFAPDLIVAQCGADAHRDDPLTDLGLSIEGYRMICRRIISLADDVCGGRLACTGGGGYSHCSVVPRAWALLFAELCAVTLPETVPPSWHALSSACLGDEAPERFLEDSGEGASPEMRERLLDETQRIIGRVLAAPPPAR